MEKKIRESSDPYYDLIDDFDLILSSFQTQYGIRLAKNLKDMKWDEFRALLIGIGPDTPLGRIVSIRSECDKDIIKNFSKDQHRIRNEWVVRRMEHVNNEANVDMSVVLEEFKNAFIMLAGGGNN